MRQVICFEDNGKSNFNRHYSILYKKPMDHGQARHCNNIVGMAWIYWKIYSRGVVYYLPWGEAPWEILLNPDFLCQIRISVMLSHIIRIPVLLCHTLTRFQVFLTTYPPTIFYGINFDKEWTFFDHLPTSSCKRSL